MSESAYPVAPSSGGRPVSRSRRILGFMIRLLRAFLLVAMVVAIVVLFEQVKDINAIRAAFGDRLDEVRTRVAELRAGQMPATEVERRLTALQTELRATREQAQATAQQVDPVLELLRQGRPAWYRAEAMYLMQMANEALQLRGDAAAALRALWLADRNLETLGDPRLLTVRETLAREMADLRALPTVDVPGISLQLSTLAAGVEQWPLRHRVPRRWAPSGSDAPADPGDSMWQQWLTHLRRLVEIRRDEGPIAALASPELERLQRLQTILQFQAARIALLQRDAATFRAELDGALGSLTQFFDEADPAVRAARQQLGVLREMPIDPKRPDLSASLTQMRALEARMVMP